MKDKLFWLFIILITVLDIYLSTSTDMNRGASLLRGALVVIVVVYFYKKNDV